MKNLILILLLLLLNCTSYTFTYGSALAEQQTTTFYQYKAGEPISSNTKDSISNNLWVIMAVDLCPSNLVIRNLCLEDILNGSPDNDRAIREQLAVVGTRLYLEGYGYWKFIKPFLEEYNKQFKSFHKYIEDMDLLFRLSAYKLNGTIYPAPFGDIAFIPLDNQDSMFVDNFEMYPIRKATLIPGLIEYTIDKCIVGLNTHVPGESTTVIISDNVCILKDTICEHFPWYQGYDKKYGSKDEELKDVFSKDKVNWILARKWWKLYYK